MPLVVGQRKAIQGCRVQRGSQRNFISIHCNRAEGYQGRTVGAKTPLCAAALEPFEAMRLSTTAGLGDIQGAAIFRPPGAFHQKRLVKRSGGAVQDSSGGPKQT